MSTLTEKTWGQIFDEQDGIVKTQSVEESSKAFPSSKREQWTFDVRAAAVLESDTETVNGKLEFAMAKELPTRKQKRNNEEVQDDGNGSIILRNGYSVEEERVPAR